MLKSLIKHARPLLPLRLIYALEGREDNEMRVLFSAVSRQPAGVPEACTFVLLQYNHAELTIDCIKHLLELRQYLPVHIIVVDNCSTDNALAEIKEFCKQNSVITILESKENIGFARGNNLGYRYARAKNANQIICIMNNDVFIEDRRFIEKAVRLYFCHAYSILGPDIVVPGKTRIHQNPFRYHFRSRSDTLDFIQACEEKIVAIRNKARHLVAPSPTGLRIKDIYRRKGHIVLHGSALVFSPTFIHDFEDAFDNRTFLYGEEDILAIRASARKHLIMYEPSMKVFHHTKASTDKANLERYYLFRYMTSIDSAKIYVSLWDEIAGTTGNM